MQIAFALKQAEAGTRIDEREGFIDNRKIYKGCIENRAGQEEAGQIVRNVKNVKITKVYPNGNLKSCNLVALQVMLKKSIT